MERRRFTLRFESASSRSRLPRRQFADSQISSGSEVSISGTPRSAWSSPATPSYAFPALNVQLAKQQTASGVFLPPRADAREGMPLKTLVKITNMLQVGCI
ncbi:unnamed protein product [Prunus armeniaca]